MNFKMTEKEISEMVKSPENYMERRHKIKQILGIPQEVEGWSVCDGEVKYTITTEQNEQIRSMEGQT